MALTTLRRMVAWRFHSRFACVEALRVAQGRIAPFFREADRNTQSRC